MTIDTFFERGDFEERIQIEYLRFGDGAFD
jgi:hypothetical protein